MVIADCKAVNLVLHFCEERKQRPSWTERNFSALARYGTGFVLIVLHKTEQRNINILTLQNLFYSRNLTFTAVKQDKVGQFPKALVLIGIFIIFVKSSCQNFRHGCVVILSFKAFDFKLSVSRFERFAVFINNHTRNIFRACKV